MVIGKFKGNKKVDVEVSGFTVHVDLPKDMGGDNEYPNPFDFLQAALTSCAAVHVLFFLEKIGFPKDNVTIELAPVFDENDDIERAAIVLHMPASFPHDKDKQLIGIVENCKVGKHLKFPREVVIVRE